MASGAKTVDLPDDFGGFEGIITVTSGSNPWPVKLFNEGQIKQAYANSEDATGRPQAAALQFQKGTSAKEGQRANLYVFPEADDDYTLEFTYYLLPNALNSTRPYAYGGAALVEVILESCLAVAEERLDDSSTVHNLRFQQLLMSAIDLDRRNKAQTLGPNIDRSTWPNGERGNVWRNWPAISVNGVVY